MLSQLKSNFLSLALAMAFLLCGSLSVHAQSNLEDFAAALPDDVKRQIDRRGNSEFIKNSVQQLYQISPDGVLTRSAIALANEHQAAQQRMGFISQILRYDLNGDLAVSRDEIGRQIQFIRQSERGQIEVFFLDYDTDKDDTISIQEISKAAKAVPLNRRNSSEQLFSFDFNGDEKVDLDEIVSVLSALPEKSSVSRQSKVRPSSSNNRSCIAPKVPAGHEVALLTGYEGRALSTIAVNGQSTETTATVVTIEEGDTPLYLVLAAFSPIVWEFEGNTDRIKTVLVQGPRGELFGPGVAVAGLSKGIVHFADPRSCLDKVPTRTGPELNAASAQLSRALGTRVTHSAATYYLQDIQMPSGTVNEARREASAQRYKQMQTFNLGGSKFALSAKGMTVLNEGGEPEKETITEGYAIREMVRFYPDGVSDYSSTELVASGQIEAYQILPSSAGILQLIALGKVEPIGRGKYRVIAPIERFPGGMSGAHSVTFFLAEGVPLPKGGLGHSTVYSEGDNACLIGTRCK